MFIASLFPMRKLTKTNGFTGTQKLNASQSALMMKRPWTTYVTRPHWEPTKPDHLMDCATSGQTVSTKLKILFISAVPDSNFPMTSST